MRILVVATFFPWPSTNGGHIRMATSIEALSQLGAVDLFSFYDQRLYRQPGSRPEVPAEVDVARLATAPYPQIGPPTRWRPAWLARGGTPLEVVMRRRDPLPRRTFDAWIDPPYDLVWFATAPTYEWLGRPTLGTTVVDLDGLEGPRERQRARMIGAAPGAQGASGVVRRISALAQARLNARDWDAFERSVAGAVDRIVLCSEDDVRRSGLPNAVAVPNTYRRPERPVGRAAVGRPPSLLFQGTFDYGPNLDGAEWLTREIAPRIRALTPDTRIRLVGRTSAGVDRLHRPPEVTVVGPVPQMETELARADVAVVPLRYGSGTRIKIIESLAHRIPVVSTTVGAEGLGADDGVHLLLADDADSFAVACRRLLTEPDLRRSLVEAGEALYLRRFERRAAGEAIRSVVAGLQGEPSPR